MGTLSVLWQKSPTKVISLLTHNFHLIHYFVAMSLAWFYALFITTTHGWLILMIMWAEKVQQGTASEKAPWPPCRFHSNGWRWCDHGESIAHRHGQWYDCGSHTVLRGEECLVTLVFHRTPDYNCCTKSGILKIQKFTDEVCRQKFELITGCSRLQSSKETTVFRKC